MTKRRKRLEKNLLWKKGTIFPVLCLITILFAACDAGSISGVVSYCEEPDSAANYRVTVEITDSSGDTQSMSTGILDGSYQFNRLADGVYTVKVVESSISGQLPANYAIWPKEDTVNIESDARKKTVNFYALDETRSWRKEIVVDPGGNTPPLPYVRLEGAPYEMGCQHGALLRNEIRGYQKASIEFVDNELKKLNDSAIFNTQTAAALIVPRWADFIEEEFGPLYHEIEGLSQSTGIDFNLMVLPNVIWELYSLFRDKVDQSLIGDKLEHCSEFAAKDSYGKIFHGYNSDFSNELSREAGKKYRAILFVNPEEEDRKSFMMPATAGCVGAYTGMNSEKISIGWDNDSHYMAEDYEGKLLADPFAPYILLLRNALEHADDIESAVELISGRFRPLADISIIADGKSNDAKAMESYPPADMRLRDLSDNGAVWSANRLQHTDWETIFGESILPGARNEQYEALLAGDQAVSIDKQASIQEVLHYGSGGSNTICNYANEYSILYVPQDLNFYISARTLVQAPCAMGTFIGFDAQNEAPLPEDTWETVTP